MREIAGQGPEKTLNRGFALVRDQSGKPVTRVAQIASGSSIEIQFSDGKVAATAGQQL
jgi:exodeoxyribonuclease VII large subunit